MNTIEVQNLVKHFGKTKAVDDISFQVEKGEVFGFLGPNGAGKTTTIRCMMDFIRPIAGTITILGRDAQKETVLLKSKMGYLSGNVELYDNWTGKMHIDFMRRKGKEDIADNLVSRLNFNPQRITKKLSSGNRQKLGLILSLMHTPEILIFDEPTSALDPLLQNTVYDLLKEASAKGTTVFMSSHNLGEVERICTRVGIIREGKMVATESMASLKKKRLYTVRVFFKEQVVKEAFMAENVEITKELPRGIFLTVKGSISPLLSKLAVLPIEDIEIKYASLEDIFLEFYKT